MKILLLTKYDSAGSSSRVRFFQYLPYLMEAGIDVHRVPLLDDSYIRRVNRGERVPLSWMAGRYLKRIRELLRLGHYDLVWLEKEIFPYLPAVFEEPFDRFRIPVVVDYDDATHLQYAMHKSAFVRALLRNKIRQVMRRASLVVVGNEYLRAAAAGMGARRIESLPSVVDLKGYRCLPANESAITTIGWIGSPHTAKYLGEIAGVLNDVARKKNAQVLLIGVADGQLSELKATRHAWTGDSEVSLINGIDIGIMPLSDGPWERGKCGYKLIQYMACGKPVVASPVGVNTEIVREGRNGLLASGPGAWARALEQLCEDPGMRRAMGQEGRKDVEERYSVQVTAPKLIELLKQIGRTREQ